MDDVKLLAQILGQPRRLNDQGLCYCNGENLQPGSLLGTKFRGGYPCVSAYRSRQILADFNGFEASLNSVAPVSFRLIHCCIGGCNQELRVALESAQGDTRAQCDRHTSISQVNRFFGNRGAYSFGKFLRQFEIAAGCDYQEFLTSVTAHDVIRTKGCRNPLHYRHQHGVSCAMPGVIVDLLKVVDIGEDDTQGISLPSATGKFPSQHVPNRAPVQDPSQAVMFRMKPQG